MHIYEVEGIGPAYAAKLKEAGVETTDALLSTGAKPKGRETLAEKTGISSKLILEWVNHVDLMRINGVGSEYSDLLEAAGVDSPVELGHRSPAHLATKIQETIKTHPEIVRRAPPMKSIEHWIAEAKTLPKIVEH